MNPVEAADTISEEHHHHDDSFRNRAALVIAVLAAILAVCELGGDNSKNAMIFNNIKASDTWSFYQAKNQRQTAYKLAEDQLKREEASTSLSPAARAAAQADLARYAKDIARYEDEPGGEGKKQLKERAENFEKTREIASRQNDDFDLAQMVLQLAIVLGSVSILATSRPLLWVAGGLGTFGAVMLANGFWFKIPIPF